MITVMHSQTNAMCAAIISNSVRAKKGKIAPLEPTYKQPDAINWKPKSQGWNKEFYRTFKDLF